MSLSQEFLDELRNRITLSTLLGRSIKVTRAGREFKACCPFHNEKTPSFTINDDKGFWHCFGCGAHGDAIRWMTDHKGLSFMDGVKELADMAGMTVPAPSRQAQEVDDRLSRLRRANEAAIAFYRRCLAETPAATAYLSNRGISAEMRERFGLGFAPDSRTALKSALAEFPVADLVAAGLLIDVEGKDPYDRFRGRIMIPIRDARGRCIGFGGRLLGAGEPKYLNSPDTPLFDKGRALFNFDQAQPAARKSGRLVAVEGYMDAIACARGGIDECVAPLGTALTEDQILLLWRLAPVPVLCFDGDKAGMKAAVRAAERVLPVLRAGFSLAICTLPEGKDPDDIVTSAGGAGLRAALAKASTLVDFLWRNVLAGMVTDTPEERAAIKARIRDLCDTIKDGEVRRGYAEQLFDRFEQHFYAKREPGQARAAASKARARDLSGVEGLGVDRTARMLVSMLLRHPAAISGHAEALASLRFDGVAGEMLRFLVDIGFSGDDPSAETVIEEAISAGFSDYLPAFSAGGDVQPAEVSTIIGQICAAHELSIECEAIKTRLQAGFEMGQITRLQEVSQRLGALNAALGAI